MGTLKRHFRKGDLLVSTDLKKRESWMIVDMFADHVLLWPSTGIYRTVARRADAHRVDYTSLQEYIEVEGKYVHMRLKR